MRLQHKQAERRGRVLLQHLGEGEEVAEALGHLLAVYEKHSRVHPRVGEALVPAAGGLRALVLVMRECQVRATAVDVDRRAQVAVHHGGALGVPAGAPLAPRARPAGLARLGGLPEGEVERVALLLPRRDARAHHKVVHVAAGYLAVAGVAAHGEVHVAVIGSVRVPLLDQALDHADHGADLLGGTRANIRVHHVGGAHDADELLGELLRYLGRGTPLLVGAIDDLVVHVGEVLREGDLVTARDEPAANHVEADKRACVADVDVVVHRGAAHVHADLALLDGLKVLFLMRSAVVDLHEGPPGGGRRARLLLGQSSQTPAR